MPTSTERYYNLQEELDNIMISNTTQDLELLQLETRMGAAEGHITTLGAGLVSDCRRNRYSRVKFSKSK